MTEQTPTEELTTEPTAPEPTAPEPIQEPASDTVAPEPTDEPKAPEAALLSSSDPQPGADADGFGGDAPEPEDPHAIKPVDQAAPDQVADLSGSYFGTTETAAGATPMADQDLAQPGHLNETEESQKGYLGETAADREAQAQEDLTLAGRKSARLAREADGSVEPGLDGTGDLDTSNR